MKEWARGRKDAKHSEQSGNGLLPPSQLGGFAGEGGAMTTIRTTGARVHVKARNALQTRRSRLAPFFAHGAIRVGAGIGCRIIS